MEQLRHLGLLQLKNTYSFQTLPFSLRLLTVNKSNVGGIKITRFRIDVEQKNDLRINYSNEQHLSSLTFYSHLLQAAMTVLQSLSAGPGRLFSPFTLLH